MGCRPLRAGPPGAVAPAPDTPRAVHRRVARRADAVPHRLVPAGAARATHPAREVRRGGPAGDIRPLGELAWGCRSRLHRPGSDRGLRTVADAVLGAVARAGIT